MAPTHSKPLNKKRQGSFFDSPMTKIAKGTAVFCDEFANSMAEGKKVPLPKNLDDTVVDVDKENVGIDWENVLKPIPKEEIAKDEEIRTCQDAMEKAICPKHSKFNMFKVFDDATWTSDGEEAKHYSICCHGTESSPCSHCSDADKVHKAPSPEAKKPPVKKNTFAQAIGFNAQDCEGEEDTPVKVSADACKWCKWDPCILEDDETNEEARVTVDNLMMQEQQGIKLEFRNYRCALCRMYARRLGCKGKRVILPVCVQCFVDKHFSEKDEERTGFKEEQDISMTMGL